MDVFVVFGIPIVGLVTISILLIIFGFKEFRYRKKIEFLKHLVDKGYETEQVDINKL